MAAQQLTLSLEDLQDVRKLFVQRVKVGLAADKRQIAALPAFLPVPDSSISGIALALDCGGTNGRAARVEILPGGRARILQSSDSVSLREHTGSAREFFAVQGALLGAVAGKHSQALPAGYCFSYAVRTLPDADAIAVKLAKELVVPGVLGYRVGRPLAEHARAAGVELDPVRVLNDTVAALIGGALDAANPRKTVGLVVGTGTNSAGFFDVEQAPKLAKTGWSQPMAVNLEHAHFKPKKRTAFDLKVDAESIVRHDALFEKMTSGLYLPLVFNAAVPEEPVDPSLGTAALSDRLTHGTAAQRVVASAILDRSADLIAAVLVGYADLYGGGTITVVAEGSTYWKTPGYPERVKQRFAELADGSAQLAVVQKENVNFIGSAIAALTPPPLQSTR